MAKEVLMAVTPPEGAAIDVIGMKGRLLGACTPKEATMIAQNWSAAKKIHTKGTCMLSDVVTELNKIDRETKGSFKSGYAHLVLAVKKIKPKYSTEFKDVAKRTLYITPPISHITEFTERVHEVVINVECTDGALVIVEESNE